MKNRLTILVICMICSSARANSSRMCTVAEREDCFHIANELCSEIPVGPEFGQCLRDLREESLPKRPCPLPPPKSPPAAKAFPDKKGSPDKKPSANDVINALKPRPGPITRGLPKEKERGVYAEPIPDWVVPRRGEIPGD
jgi:hypothetical protein